VYPKKIAKSTVGIELDKHQAIKVMAALASYIAAPASDSQRLIMTAYKRNATKAGNVPISFISGKNK
jgi:hypothetical protein